MARCGATFDENSVPPWTRGGLQGGFERGNQPTPELRDRCRFVTAVAVVKASQAFTPSNGGIFTTG
jgi:hypothetical protein